MCYTTKEHPFTLQYTLEDVSGKYYCDICEEERDQKPWLTIQIIGMNSRITMVNGSVLSNLIWVLGCLSLCED